MLTPHDGAAAAFSRGHVLILREAVDLSTDSSGPFSNFKCLAIGDPKGCPPLAPINGLLWI